MAYDLLAQREYDAEGRADRDLPPSALPARRPECEGCGDQYHRDDRERNAGLSPQFLFIAYRLLMPLSEVMDIPVERDRRWGFSGTHHKLNVLGRTRRDSVGRAPWSALQFMSPARLSPTPEH